MTASEQRKAAKEFADRWQGHGYEKGESQRFWSDLLQTVYGVEIPSAYMECEVQVQLEHTSFIDIYLPATKVMIEQKSLGKDLSKPIKQSDGSMLTPMQQLKRYAAALGYSRYPRWGITCNFAEFYIYDMDQPNGEPSILRLADLPEEYHRLNFLVDMGDDRIQKELEISLNAGTLVGRLYDSLLQQYGDNPTEEILKSLNMLIVRIVFCLYAEDAGILGHRSIFHEYLSDYKPQQIRRALLDLFAVLDTPVAERDPYLEENLAQFPYVNGGLFASSQHMMVPQFSEECVRLIMDVACPFDWSGISPTIFGAVFESTLSAKVRRSGGMHYTSLENIHKVIDPLFLNDLKAEYESILEMQQENKRRRLLEDFQDKLAGLTFLDPAAGSGNFLTETYISLRRLENQVISQLTRGQVLLGLGDMADPVKVSIQQFYGIEINDFACVVAKTAMWIAELQMLEETREIIERDIDLLPLKTYVNIIEGNALQLDWEKVVPKEKCDYIMGNPPFVGASMMTSEQKNDVENCIGKGKLTRSIDYVGAWYHKTAEYIQHTSISCAFVSTNSITQGEQVFPLWDKLINLYSINIFFAYRTFKWDSESNAKAHVHCVIIGFDSWPASHRQKKIFTTDGYAIASNISPYLLDSKNILVVSHSKPICDVPVLTKGNQPSDGGHLILKAEEKEAILKAEPQLEKFIRRYVGATEYLHNTTRYCLWLKNASPAEMRNSKILSQRIAAVRRMRENSSAKPTREKALTPWLFFFMPQPDTNYILIPRHSSENRRYIPMGFLPPEIIASDAVSIISDATLYHLGILTSNIHMAWMRTVAGRLKSDYRYSGAVVYNTFPWPTPTEAQRARIEETAQGILDARALYPDSSLADLYDEVLMPVELRRAHQYNDRAVMEAYDFWGTVKTESQCVAQLMEMYQHLTQP